MTGIGLMLVVAVLALAVLAGVIALGVRIGTRPPNKEK